ncbi:sigma-70 family RNA polymerase sigma factor [Acuticoccus sp.]|uniref:sigma-70 family RNA polymerase sigma factor n=1 Tax=Acuticoccus sp. TaxID=1904378 RepID=UPI003B517716
MDTQDYAETLSACARGDKAALRALFEAEGPRLIGVAQRILHRRELAEEAVQEGFAQIWASADRYDPVVGSARSWIYAVIRYRALNMVRKEARETSMPAEQLDPLVDAQANVDAGWMTLHSESMLRRCLEDLEPQRRHALLLAYVLGLTHGEIAGRMGVPLGTAKAWVRRALIALRECMR